MSKIYTKKEDLGNISKLIALLLAWCGAFLVANDGSRQTWLSCAAGVCIISIVIYFQARQGVRYRRNHRECVRQNTPYKGIIIDCKAEKKVYRVRNGKNVEYSYYLIVSVQLPWDPYPVTIKSDAYTKPVYQLLASPKVDVYQSDTESGYTIDGFVYKRWANEPDILPETLRAELPDTFGSNLIPMLMLVLFGAAILSAVLYGKG